MDLGKDFNSIEWKFTVDLYRWYFRHERGEDLDPDDSARVETFTKLTEILRVSENIPDLEEVEVLASIPLKTRLIKILEEKYPEKFYGSDTRQMLKLFGEDILKSEKRHKTIKITLTRGKKELVYKLLADRDCTSVQALEILSAMAEIGSGLQKIDMINEAYWGIRSELRSKNAINKKRDDILYEESQKILAELGEVEKPIDRIKLVEKLYIKVQAPKIPGQTHSKAESFVEKTGDRLAVNETPEVLEDIEENLTGLEKLAAIKELFGLTRVHSNARAMIEKKWDASADSEYHLIMEKINHSKEGLERIEAVRELWMSTRMGSSAETRIVEQWEKIISQEVNKILGDICALRLKSQRDQMINRLWVAIARFPEKRKAFKEIFDQLFAPSVEGEDFLSLEY